MDWVHRTIIVPAPYAAAASAACEHLAGAGGAGMYTTPLSPTGELPATHYISSGLIEQDFAALLASPDTLTAVATSAGLDAAPLITIISASDITDEAAGTALARLGLQLCRQEAVLTPPAVRIAEPAGVMSVEVAPEVKVSSGTVKSSRSSQVCYVVTLE